MSVSKRRKCLITLSGAVSLIALSAQGAVVVSSSGTSGSSCLQIPSVVPASPWTMAYDPSTAAADVTTLASKGLYTQSTGITAASNMSWANTAAGGIQILLPHTIGSAAVLGLGALNSSATFNPANVDGSILGIDTISLTMIGGQTGTANDSGQLALLLVQGGKFYRSSWTVFHNNYAVNPTTINLTGLTAASFGEITITRMGTDGGNTNFGSNPDFTPTGSSIRLGWLAGYDSTLGLVNNNNRTVVTSWSATVTGIVPEPTALSALALGVTLLARKRNSAR